VSKYIKSIPFFKYRDTGVITDQDSYEIASSLKFEKFKAGEKVVNFGDDGDKFYIILKGVVSVQIRNPRIQDYRLQEREYNKLKEWKRDEFDPKLKVELENKYQKFMYLEVISEKLKNAARERRCTL
jgi:signal-transduction protein with cAMP-binding, CBS, and nucleotidyltransferase domain